MVMNGIHRLRLRHTGVLVVLSWVVTAVGQGTPGEAWAQETAAFFRQNCASCHTIGGGRLTGPDLKNVTQRRDRDWLRRYIANPSAVINSGDPIARQLVEEARGVIMPQIPGLTPEKIDFLLELIDAESKLERSQFAGVPVSMEPFTPADVARGLALFTGKRRFASGAPACMSCHTVPGLPGLGGGRFGPDLTRVYERLQGRASMTAWLSAPATPVMGALLQKTPLQPEEINALVALFEDRAKLPEPVPTVAMMNFSLLGLGGAVLVLLIMDAVWRYRLRSVRRALVEENKI
jgi:mono/diheme cytochrome c family protein